ncbi:homoserine O-acetyltransferase [Leifsonia sp. Leaf325]|nr:homoserine O-acetyltransferase [Leifsonia sp. Leaf325]KQQ95765.1 homoserine O-acetyltransferase [Leifsonia sp. Leaf325]
MDWQTPADFETASLITEAQARALAGKPPVTGAWHEGDQLGDRRFVPVGSLELERGGTLPFARLAYETWGTLSPARDNAVLVLHALTGDSHVFGSASAGHVTSGWWNGVVGPGRPIDTDRWFVVAPNLLGGCQGSTGPASLAPDGAEWGSRFPYLTIRDQVAAQVALADALGIERWGAVVGGSMGGMHALEWAITHPERVERLAVLAVPPALTADQIAANSLQLEAVRMDPNFRGGDYYDGDEGPATGLALARRLAMLNYRSSSELNDRFARSWQSGISPLGDGGRFAVESYLDFHGNRFVRRFDANSYITLVDAMNSHDVGRGRGGAASALSGITALTLVLGISSDRLFPLAGQEVIARAVPNTLDGEHPVVIDSPFGHDGFLIEEDAVGRHLLRLLDATAARR